MLFNSLQFAVFLLITFILYWFVANRSLNVQNGLLLLSSYFFYSFWDWRFVFLLIFSTLLDFFTALKMDKSDSSKSRKFWFWLSISINLGLLGVFKYFNFISTVFTSFLNAQNNYSEAHPPLLLQLILPIGISFYTFHGLSYVIDVYQNRIKPEKNFLNYAVFVAFFPLLVAGPIERATHLLPQIQRNRTFNQAIATNGLKQILWGLFKKMVIADNCAEIANYVFGNANSLSGSNHLVGAIAFTFQIYGDFSGYTDIAIGTAKLFGIELIRNFSFPYFSRSISEFWRRWHISLSTWFKDYLYIPLGGSKGTIWKKISNIIIIFLVSGFWHGANWTFIVWGLLNAIYILPSIIFKSNRRYLDIIANGKIIPTFKEFYSMILTFGLTVFAWIFFRSDNLTAAFCFIRGLFCNSLFSRPSIFPRSLILLIITFMLIEWFGREKEFAIAEMGGNWPKVARWLFYYSLIAAIFYWAGTPQLFIYFQF